MNVLYKKERARKKRTNQNTLLFNCIFTLIILLQNGYFHNWPIILIIIPLLFFGKKYYLLMGKCEIYVFNYGVYLISVTLFFSRYNYDKKYTLNIICQYIIIFICIHFEMQKVNSRIFLLYFRNIGMILSTLCIPEVIFERHFLADLLGKTSNSSSIFRAISIFNHPIVCGSFLVMSLCLLLLYPLKKQEQQILFLIIIISAILLTQSRSAWIASVFILVSYYLKFRKQKINKNHLIYGLGIIIIVPIIGFGFGHNLVEEIFNFIYSRVDGTLEAGEGHIVRIEIILNSIIYWKSNLIQFIFGSGKNFGLFFMKKNPVHKFGTFTWDTAVDNQYITIFHETGVIGFIFIIMTVITTFKRLLKASKENKEQILSCLCVLANAICLFFFDGFNYPILVLVYLIMIIISDKYFTYD